MVLRGERLESLNHTAYNVFKVNLFHHFLYIEREKIESEYFI